jgi:DNA-binding GntR family transcriptional regulator
VEVIKRQPSLRDQAVEQIRVGIVTGTLTPGSLHSEQTIANRLALSRTPIREALLQLEREKLVEFIPHRGVRIADVAPEALVHVFELRAAIEGYGAARIAAEADPQQIAALDRELERQRDIVKTGDRLIWVEANMDFHTLLAHGSGNPLMIEAFLPLASHTMRIGYRMNYRRQRMDESITEHAAIVDAIRRGSIEHARELAEKHLYITTVLMKQMFSDLAPPDRKSLEVVDGDR